MLLDGMQRFFGACLYRLLCAHLTSMTVHLCHTTSAKHSSAAERDPASDWHGQYALDPLFAGGPIRHVLRERVDCGDVTTAQRGQMASRMQFTGSLGTSLGVHQLSFPCLFPAHLACHPLSGRIIRCTPTRPPAAAWPPAQRDGIMHLWWRGPQPSIRSRVRL